MITLDLKKMPGRFGLAAALALTVAAGCATQTNLTLVNSRRLSAEPPVVRTLLVTMDSPGLFRAYERWSWAPGDAVEADKDTTLYLPICLAESLAERLAAHHVRVAYAFTGFSDSGEAEVDSLARAMDAEALLRISCPHVTGGFRITLAELLGLPATALAETPRLVLSDLDLDLTMPSTARPDRNIWKAYMQVERGQGRLAAFADSTAAVIVRQLAADGVVPRI